jgi:hypothetical protein
MLLPVVIQTPEFNSSTNNNSHSTATVYQKKLQDVNGNIFFYVNYYPSCDLRIRLGGASR